MGVFTGYKVTTYSHDHPNNRFDRKPLEVSVTQGGMGGFWWGFALNVAAATQSAP
jgi:hypothetical protein